MNRTERLFALVLLLQNRPNLTSKALSAHFGVSRRTIFRDLRALSESGVPLTYAEEGGYEILEGYQLPPLMLSAREAATLLLGTAFMALQSDASLRKDADQVGLKIRSVLPSEIRDYIDRLRERTVLDPYWIHEPTDDQDKEGMWYRLSEAVAKERKVIMTYFVASRAEETRRTVDPLGLVYYADHWNLIAFDHLRKEIRNFRLDRILTLHVLTERFEKPLDFDLQEHVARDGQRQASTTIRLWFDSALYARARRGIPARVDTEERLGNGVEITFRFDNLPYVASWLLRFGPEAKAVAPEALRKLVADLARETAGQY
jgi:predicted DNA-binding transcriptional regulator YafY